jgi:hypothetical protein
VGGWGLAGLSGGSTGAGGAGDGGGPPIGTGGGLPLP